jgi:hypothetical protein
VALAIQRAGGDYLGPVGSVHQDFIDLLHMIPEEVREGWSSIPDPPPEPEPPTFFERVSNWIRG